VFNGFILQKTHQSSDDNPSHAVMCESFEAGHSDHHATSEVTRLLGITSPSLRLDSMCKYGLVSRGDSSLYLRFPRAGYSECIWDHAPGVIVLQEAGGRATDGEGKPLDFSLGRRLVSNTGLVVTNGLIHDAVLAAVRTALGSPTSGL